MGYQCIVCKNDTNLKPLSIFYSGPIKNLHATGSCWICTRCLDSCKICTTCGKKIKSYQVENALKNENKDSLEFCSCNQIPLPKIKITKSVDIPKACIKDDKTLFDNYCDVVGNFLKKILEKNISFYDNLNKDNYSLFGYFITIFLGFIFLNSLVGNSLEYCVYQILRIVVFLFCSWSLYLQNQKQKMQKWILPNLAIAILFNPIASITLEEETWDVVDFVVLVYLVVFQLKWQKVDCHGDKSPRNDVD